jgi:Tol biopolymer transport system component
MSMIGKTLAHYEITSQLGKGGMGEVFQAKDRKLGRDVAIKVLPEEFAKDADRVSRFQREAKLLASLNHPNIAAIYGLEASDQTNFLVLELVEGETLADQIKRGPIPVEESLKLALQIAEALEAAHEKGVIHRDLKPANIKVTPEGKAKVLDFGLAKAFAGEQAELNLSNSPTLSNAATQQGVILGTAAYMSPEQARGKAADKRADIWAFGCVLFEMLTGRAAFSGRDITEILAAVIRAEPEWASLPANLHWRLREVIERCLKKEAKDRYHDISDVKSDIQRVLADPSGLFVQPITGAELRVRLQAILPWVAVAVVLTAIIAGLAVWKLRPAEPRQVMRFDYELPEGQQFSTTTSGMFTLAVSPDGKQFVYPTPKGLYLRSVNELTAKLISGTEGDTQQPFFSPDGQWIGYLSNDDHALKKIAINGGAPVTLCVVQQLAGASWNADNTIVYSQFRGDIVRISANGGAQQSLVKAKSRILIAPQILPDGKSVLFTAFSAPASTKVYSQLKIMVQSLKSGESKELFEGLAAQYLPTGHIIYKQTNGSKVFGIPFNLDRLDVAGRPVSLIENVNSLAYAISDAGTLVYVPQITSTGLDSAKGRTLVWVDRTGHEEPLPAPSNAYAWPKISPDGTRVALTIRDTGGYDIWIWDLARKTMTRLTFDRKNNQISIWTPDGKRIVYLSLREGVKGSVYWKAADGTGEDEKLGSAPNRLLVPSCFAKDGKTLVMTELLSNEIAGIGTLSMVGDRARKPLLQHEEYSEAMPNISPDGRWMAYASTESGKLDVYVRPFPEVNKGRWQVSTNGGGSPLWSPNGRELFYLTTDSAMAVSVKTEPTFSLGTPKTLFRLTNVVNNPMEGTQWDISPDGERFLIMKGAGAEAPRKINIVLNWLEELKQRVPVK